MDRFLEMFLDIILILFYITQHIVLESIWEGIWKMGDQAGWVTCAGSWLPKCVGGVWLLIFILFQYSFQMMRSLCQEECEADVVKTCASNFVLEQITGTHSSSPMSERMRYSECNFGTDSR